MSRKTARIARMTEHLRGEKLDPHYLGFFDCFNRGQFYEAHEVLEHLWLQDKHGPNGAFFKGLIQLAGAFVHLQKKRLSPAAALFKLALANLEKYPPEHEHLNLGQVCGLIQDWLKMLEMPRVAADPLTEKGAPKLALILPHS